MLESPKLPEFKEEYFPRPTLEISLLILLDLHFGQEAFGFSLMLKVSISNTFEHLSHLNS